MKTETQLQASHCVSIRLVLRSEFSGIIRIVKTKNEQVKEKIN